MTNYAYQDHYYPIKTCHVKAIATYIKTHKLTEIHLTNYATTLAVRLTNYKEEMHPIVIELENRYDTKGFYSEIYFHNVFIREFEIEKNRGRYLGYSVLGSTTTLQQQIDHIQQYLSQLLGLPIIIKLDHFQLHTECSQWIQNACQPLFQVVSHY